jgi:hypothetical protein
LARAWWWLAALALAVLGCLLLHTEREPEPSAVAWSSPRVAVEEPERAAPPDARRIPAPVAEEPPVSRAQPPVVPPEPEHPHPLTPAHARIYRENNLLGALNGALDVEDAAGLRRLLEAYQDEYPEDPHALQEGYAIIADCLEHPGAGSSDAARQYYETETASTLRRYVRRHCLERRQ